MSNDTRLGTDPLAHLKTEAEEEARLRGEDCDATPTPGNGNGAALGRDEQALSRIFETPPEDSWKPLEVLENTIQPFLVTSLDGDVVYANPAVAALYCDDREALYRCNWYRDLFTAQGGHTEDEVSKKLLRTGTFYEYPSTLRCKDGTQRAMHVCRYAARDAQGATRYFFSFLSEQEIPSAPAPRFPAQANADSPPLHRLVKGNLAALLDILVLPESTMSKNKVKVEGMLELGRVIEYLESVVASLKAGTLRFESGDQAITLIPPGVVDVEMQASQKKDKEKFSFEITWRQEYTAMRDTNVGISSDEPAEKK